MHIITASDEEMKVVEALQNNLVAHMLFIPEQLTTCTVVKAQELMIINSHLYDSSYNIILRARLEEERVMEVIDSTLSYFYREQLPVAWWVGPSDMPSELPTLLRDAGMHHAEKNIGMMLSIEYYGYEQIELCIERAITPEQIEDVMKVMLQVQGYSEAHQDWYMQLRQLELSLADYEQFYIGYLDEKPVTCGSVTLHADVAGIYNVATVPAYRKRGFATAMVQELLMRSQEAGYNTAVLIAQEEGVHLYERLGFEAICEFDVFEFKA